LAKIILFKIQFTLKGHSEITDILSNVGFTSFFEKIEASSISSIKIYFLKNYQNLGKMEQTLDSVLPHGHVVETVHSSGTKWKLAFTFVMYTRNVALFSYKWSFFI